MAQGVINGNMDLQHLSTLLGAAIDPRSTSLYLNNGSVTARLTGSGFTYDAFDQLTGGTVSGLQYNSPSFSLNLTTAGLSAANFASWVYYDQTQVAFATILAGNDSLSGGAGDDLIRGYAGNDTLTGAGGADTLAGGSGADVFNGFAGADRILDFNAAEGDQIVLAAGATYSLAQSGADAVVSLSGGAQVTLVGVQTSSLAGNWISGGTASGGGGSGGAGGGAGGSPFGSLTPTAALAISTGDTLTLGAGTATGVTVIYNPDGAISLTLNGQSMTFGSAISDVSKAGRINLPDGSKLFIGLSGTETFTGGTTGDAAFGGAGDDTLDGGLGGDLLQGNQGVDSLLGGEGSDTVYGGQDADMLSMGAGANFGQGNRGADIISAGEGIDTLLGGQDNDTIIGAGGADFLNGNLGDDTIYGGNGNDTIYGEGGADTLAGGAGADVFRGFTGGGLDRVLDFSRAEGDRVMLDPGTGYTAAQSGADTVVTYGANQIVLVGVSFASLTGDWIVA